LSLSKNLNLNIAGTVMSNISGFMKQKDNYIISEKVDNTSNNYNSLLTKSKKVDLFSIGILAGITYKL
jgi:hypothetical protein